MARYSTTLLSDPVEFVSTLCNVVPINLPASHVNALRIMNSLLSTSFLAGRQPNPTAYLSSDKHSFRERIAWMDRSGHGAGTGAGAAQVFEQLKRHLLLVRWAVCMYVCMYLCIYVSIYCELCGLHGMYV